MTTHPDVNAEPGRFESPGENNPGSEILAAASVLADEGSVISWELVNWTPAHPFRAHIEFVDESGPILQLDLDPATTRALRDTFAVVLSSQQEALGVVTPDAQGALGAPDTLATTDGLVVKAVQDAAPNPIVQWFRVHYIAAAPVLIAVTLALYSFIRGLFAV